MDGEKRSVGSEAIGIGLIETFERRYQVIEKQLKRRDFLLELSILLQDLVIGL